ncbi:MAG: Cas9 endonuclease PAM-interacting domain-containing protein, partial [Bacilli bacterium]
GPISNTKKYGGYNKPSTAYFFMVESLDKKGKKIVSIESMPVMFAERYERDENFAYKLMTGYFKLVEPKILVKKILINSLIKIGKTPCRIAGKSGDSLLIAHNIQWNVDQNTINYLHLLEKYRSRQVEKKQFDFKHPLDKNINKFELNGLPISTESKLKLQVLSKEKNLQIYQKIQHQLSKEIYSGLSSLKKLRGIIGNGIEKFVELDIKSQVIVLFELINILKSNRTESDLLIIGGSKHNGNLKISKKVSKDKEIRIINQSVTGVYEKVEYITGKEN